jgi:hypothetical protein
MGGMRLAADKIVAALKRLKFATDPAWVEAEARLAQLHLDAAAAAKLPLEDEGVAYEEPRPKVRLFPRCRSGPIQRHLSLSLHAGALPAPLHAARQRGAQCPRLRFLRPPSSSPSMTPEKLIKPGCLARSLPANA